MTRTRVKLATVSFALVALQFGLAIWAWGGVADFFSHPAFVALLAGTVVFTVAAAFTEGNISSGEKEDRANRWCCRCSP